jgi:hypothetical protein
VAVIIAIAIAIAFAVAIDLGCPRSRRHHVHKLHRQHAAAASS